MRCDAEGARDFWREMEGERGRQRDRLRIVKKGERQ